MSLYLINLRKALHAKKRRMAADALDIAPKLTPIDTGEAKSNWHVAEGQPSHRYNKFPEGLKISSNMAESMSARRIDNIQSEPVGDLYVTCTAPHASALEHGHSKQAPNGMLSGTRAGILGRHT